MTLRTASCVYLITSAKSGDFYVGSAGKFERRMRQHLYSLRRGTHHNRFLQRLYAKYGEGNLRFSVLIVCHRDDLFFYEQRAIDILKPAFNLSPTACGTRGIVWSEASKAKIAGRVVSAETRAAITAAMLRNTTPEQRTEISKLARAAWTESSTKSQIAKLTGRKHSAETIALRAAKLIGRTVSQETRRKLALQAGWRHTEDAKRKMRGRMFTEEHRQKLSLAHVGKPGIKGVIVPEERRAKISAALKGRPRSPESIAKQRETNARKRVSP